MYPGWHHGTYNNWFVRNGKNVFHGFFQDDYGAVMIIVDDSVDQGDGSGATEVSGSIWFKNYPNTSYTQGVQPLSTVPCWFRTTGPYDCRTFLVSGNYGDGNISSTSALYPTESQYIQPTSLNAYAVQTPARGWTRLGTFTGLNKVKAFGQ